MNSKISRFVHVLRRALSACRKSTETVFGSLRCALNALHMNVAFYMQFWFISVTIVRLILHYFLSQCLVQGLRCVIDYSRANDRLRYILSPHASIFRIFNVWRSKKITKSPVKLAITQQKWLWALADGQYPPISRRKNPLHRKNHIFT